jgi:hypothetical protein
MNPYTEPTVYEEHIRGRLVQYLPTDDGSVIPQYKLFIDRLYVSTQSLAAGRRKAEEAIDALEHRLFVNRPS